METTYDYRKKLTEEQKKIIDKAIELLTPYNKEKVSHEIAYFESVDEDGDKTDDLDLMEYDTCNNDSCVLAVLDELRNEYPKIKIREWYMDNNGDHENIGSCYMCGRPLNEFLTWIGQEFEHHKTESTKKSDFIESRTAFDIIAILQSFPSIDHEIREYHIHQKKLGNPIPLQQELGRQTHFVNEVIDYAKNIIKELR